MYTFRRQGGSSFAERCSVILWGVLGWLVLAPPAVGQTPDDWEVIRVFTKELDRVSWWLARDYDLVEIEDLARQLRSVSAQRKTALLQAPKLDEAIYVARLEEEGLVSEQSRWVFSGKTQGAYYNMGPVSVALRPARELPAGKEQLLDHQLVTPAGELELSLSEDSTQRWFGFSKRPEESGEATFRFQLPMASSARMLITTSLQTQLQSDDVVVEKVDSPLSFLPDDWPKTSVTFLGGTVGRQWWVVHLSGTSQFELSTTLPDKANPNKYQHTLRSSDVEYIAGHAMLEVHAHFELATSSPMAPIRLLLADELRISSVLVDGIAATLQLHPSSKEAVNLVEIESLPSGQATSIEVTAACPLNRDAPLPKLTVDESFAIRGSARIFSEEGLVVDELRAEKCTISSVLGQLPFQWAPEYDLEKLSWTATWAGVAPKLEASFSRRQNQWTAQSLTRFAVQSDWLSANCRLQLESKDVDSNELVMRVGEGWFVDDVKLLNAEASDIHADFVERDTDQAPITDVVIRWDQKRDAVAIELELVAHRPQRTRPENIRLWTRRLLTIPDAEQVDNYVIEPSARYQVQVTPNLLQFQLQPIDLPRWQQQLLPPASNLWIFQRMQPAVAPVNLVAGKADFSVQLATVVGAQTDLGDAADARSVEYYLRIQPISGAIDSVMISAPSGFDANALQWTLISEDETTPESLIPRVSEAIGGAAGFELKLQERKDAAFVLQGVGELRASQSGQYPVAILGIPQAISGESTLMVPSSLSRFQGGRAMEMLPADTCCDGEELLPLFSTDADSGFSSHTAARLDVKNEQVIVLREAAKASTGWCWNESVEHWIDGGDTRSHRMSWHVEVTDDPWFKIHIPNLWRVTRITVDDNVLPLARLPEDRLLRVELPKRQKSLLTVECVSGGNHASWIQPERPQRPEVSFPVYASSHTLYIPPSKLPLGVLAQQQVGRRLRDRLLPARWWSWLSPMVDGKTAPNALHPGWSKISVASQIDSVSSEQGTTFWIVDRAAVAGLALACVVLATFLWWSMLGNSTRRCWLLLGALVVTLVLVPNRWVGVMQLILLSAILASLLRLAQVVLVRRNDRTDPSGARLRSSLSHMVGVWLLIVVLQTQTGMAQFDTPATSSIGANNSTEKQGPEIFGVILPIDEDGQLSGAYAYVPTRLRKLLNNPSEFAEGKAAPRVLSADYTLRVNATNTLDRNYVEELSGEFRVFLGGSGGELPLSLWFRDLPIRRIEVNGQANVTTDTALTLPAGTYLLKLYFDPLVSLDEKGHAHLQTQIPSIPSANLRVISDGNTQVEVQSVGRQSRVGNDLNVALGPSRRLDCRWYTQSDSFSVPRPVTTVSSLWLNADGEQLTAAAMLQIENSNELPELFHIVIHDGWEPIGSQWDDVEMLSSETVGLSNQRKYAVRLKRGPLSEITNEATVRLLLAPNLKSTTSMLNLPFLTLHEVGTSTVRNFRWSASGRPVWEPDGIEIWPSLPPSEMVDWGEFGLAETADSYRVPNSSLSTAIHRQPTVQYEPVSEIMQVHLSLTDARLQYRAEWPTAISRSSALRFQIPTGCRVKRLLVDGASWDYQIVQQQDRSLLLVSAPMDRAGLQEVDLELSYPIRLAQRMPLPRIHLLGFPASSSVLRLLLGAGLECQIENPTQAPVDLELVSARPTELLANLETLVGQVDLENNYREAARLPLEFVLRRRQAIRQAGAVMYVTREAQGWQAQVDAYWLSDQQPLDFVFFDLPADLRESIDAGQLPRRFIPMGDSNHATLCLIPPAPVDGRTTVSFRFALNAAAGQTLSLPKIDMLSANLSELVLALPKEIDGQAVTWQSGSRELDRSWKDPFHPDWMGQYKYFSRDSSQLQATWETSERRDRTARLLATQVRLNSVAEMQSVGVVDYWVEPRGQLDWLLDVPRELTVVGVTVGGRPANWTPVAGRRINVLLQPNYLPVCVRVLARWQHDATGEPVMAIPEVVAGNATENAKTMVEILDPRWRLKSQDSELSSFGLFTQLWSETVANAAPNALGFAEAEKVAWLRGWHHASFNIDENDLVVVQSVTNPEDSPEGTPVQDFWADVCEQLEVAPEAVGPEAMESSEEVPRYLAGPRRLYTTRQSNLKLTRELASAGVYPRVIAAGLLASVVLLILRVASGVRTRYFEMLSRHPWTYWLQLAVLTWLFLPVVWPSLVLVVTAGGMALGQYLDFRRAVQFR